MKKVILLTVLAALLFIPQMNTTENLAVGIDQPLFDPIQPPTR